MSVAVLFPNGLYCTYLMSSKLPNSTYKYLVHLHFVNMYKLQKTKKVIFCIIMIDVYKKKTEK